MNAFVLPRLCIIIINVDNGHFNLSTQYTRPVDCYNVSSEFSFVLEILKKSGNYERRQARTIPSVTALD